MKKLTFILGLFFLSSCSYATITTKYIGSVTAYTNNGEIIKKYDDVTITSQTGSASNENIFKSYGINFYDKESGNFVVINNAVPCIVEYNVEYNIDNSSLPTSHDTNEDERQKELLDQYSALQTQYKVIKKEIKEKSKQDRNYKDSKDYKEAIAHKNNIHSLMLEIEKELINKYNIYL
jgi:hypothetical protein